MQTFVPYADAKLSAKSLDYRRLGKQRVECLQIMNTLNAIKAGEGKRGWAGHPAVKMWEGHEGFLAEYSIEMCNEWIRRGYNDNLRDRFGPMYIDKDRTPPFWWGREDVHYSHQCQLVNKNPLYYRSKFPNADPSVRYVWPV